MSDSPIAFRPGSNGEFCPPEETEEHRRAEALFRRTIEEQHRRAAPAGVSRRDFARSACGVAAALWTINQVSGCRGADDPGYAVTPDMMVDQGLACQRLAGDEFIFDVQIHPPSPLSPWRDAPLPSSADDLIRAVFVSSDTAVGCLSGVPDARQGGEPNVAANRQFQELVERLGGPRLIFHANVDPTRGPAELDYMAEIAGKYRIGAWKVYPHVGPWRLDRDVGAAFLTRARALGVKIIAAHRGIGPDTDYGGTTSPIDLVLAARAFPDLSFLTYHSAWDSAVNEDHPFDPADPNPQGVDRLIKALRDHGTSGNVYAELGSTWRSLMSAPAQAAHVLGKLLRYLGEDQILWGTDAVFTGSPQEQIVAFRSFQIPAAMQERYGYPALTDTARRKILGGNGARVYGVDPQAVRCAIAGDAVSRARADGQGLPWTRVPGYGPRTRREYLAMLRWERGR